MTDFRRAPGPQRTQMRNTAILSAVRAVLIGVGYAHALSRNLIAGDSLKLAGLFVIPFVAAVAAAIIGASVAAGRPRVASPWPRVVMMVLAVAVNLIVVRSADAGTIVALVVCATLVPAATATFANYFASL